LIKVVGPSLEQKYTNMRENIHVKVIVAMSFTKLASGNSLHKIWHPL
jgi:hypothetical protein